MKNRDKQRPAIQILVQELIDIKDIKALQMLKKDLTRDLSKEFLHYQDLEACDMIDEFLDEMNLNNTLNEIGKEF